MSHSLFKSRSFTALLSYRLCVIMCYQITAVVVGWQIYELTHDKLALGLIGLAEVLPYFANALFAGYAVDHYDKRRLGLFACVLLLTMAVMLAVFSSHILPILERYGAWPIYAAIALSGVARAFLNPVYNTLMAQLIPRELYSRAAGIGASVFQFAQILGPAIGGGLLAIGNPTIAYIVTIVFASAATVALLFIQSTPPLKQSRPSLRDAREIFSSIGQGLRFVFGHQILLSALALDMFAVLFGGAMALLPAFVSDVLHSGPETLGLLRAAPAIGAIMMGLYLTRRPISRHAGKILLCVVAGFGLCMIAFALSKHLWLSMVLLGISGLLDSVSVVLRSTILQLATPDNMRGRVSSINGIFIGSSNELGAFESGVTANWLGLVPSVVVGGLLTLVVVVATVKLAPKLRRLHLNDLL